MIAMPASIVVWDVCEDSDITDGSFAQMRGGNTRTAGHRVFLFIVKSDIDVFVSSVAKSKGFYFVCRGRRPRRPEVVSVKKCTSVYRQNNKNTTRFVGTGVLDCPRS